MSDDLDLRGIDQRHEPDPEFRAALRRRVLDDRRGHRSGLGDRDPRTSPRSTSNRHATTSGPRRRSRRVTHVVLAIAVAAAVVHHVGGDLPRRHDRTGRHPDPVPSPLEEPSRDEVARRQQRRRLRAR